MKKNKLIYVVMIVMIFAIIVEGCQAAQRPASPRITPRTTRYTPSAPKTTPSIPSPGVPSPSVPNNLSTTPSTVNMRASTIANAVNKINGVDRSSVVISGNNAVVGVKVTSNYPGNDIDKLKRNVVNTVKTTDKGIKNVYVTTDAGLFDRIDRIAKDITSGKSLTGFSDEIGDIIKKISH
ncbi:YhcN/YlaJ family sporulation lipoprotein [Calorimonas adulescens]|uniref:YhcN/YlaJ family sporulation lipoprotein n=1 Tax=Calorimonas adulescens TaxID=2606906 RepID=A0A5D8QCU6_9THEO|nr:YhcN/YlaJ family sporulation lipoprotein [Calorimonas adulescens]TZE81939.1 YhcN/YlaJ family sporulation lipoprotein [Calorimonas adulescens]